MLPGRAAAERLCSAVMPENAPSMSDAKTTTSLAGVMPAAILVQ